MDGEEMERVVSVGSMWRSRNKRDRQTDRLRDRERGGARKFNFPRIAVQAKFNLCNNYSSLKYYRLR